MNPTGKGPNSPKFLSKYFLTYNDFKTINNSFSSKWHLSTSSTTASSTKRACKIILGKNYNSYIDAVETYELDTLSLPNCQRTSSLIPPTRRSVHGRDLRNSNSISLLPCRTERFRKSPIPYFIDLLNNRI